MLEKLFNRLERLSPERHRWVFSHEGVRRYFGNTGWMLFGQVIYLLLSFFIGAWIARYLGPEDYGTVSYVVAFVGLFSFLSSLGINSVLKRELVSNASQHKSLLGTGIRIKIFGAVLACLAAITTSFFVIERGSLIQILVILFSFSFFIQTGFIISNYFYASVQAKKAIQSQLGAVLISSALKVGLILAGKGIIYLIIIYLLDSLWQVLFLVYYYQKDGYKIREWQFDWSIARSLWRDSWPLMLSSAAAYIYLRVDQVMLGQMLNQTAVGIYAAGVKVTEVLYFIPSVITGSLFTAIVNARKSSLRTYYDRLKKLYLLLLALALLVAVPVSLLAKTVITVVFGTKYLASIPVLQFYVWSSLGHFVGSGVSSQLLAENRTKAIFWLNFTAMFINVALNFYLIPKIGLVGAALATFVSYLVAPLWLLLIGWRRGKRTALALK